MQFLFCKHNKVPTVYQLLICQGFCPWQCIITELAAKKRTVCSNWPTFIHGAVLTIVLLILHTNIGQCSFEPYSALWQDEWHTNQRINQKVVGGPDHPTLQSNITKRGMLVSSDLLCFSPKEWILYPRLLSVHALHWTKLPTLEITSISGWLALCVGLCEAPATSSWSKGIISKRCKGWDQKFR